VCAGNQVRAHVRLVTLSAAKNLGSSAVTPRLRDVWRHQHDTTKASGNAPRLAYEAEARSVSQTPRPNHNGGWRIRSSRVEDVTAEDPILRCAQMTAEHEHEPDFQRHNCPQKVNLRTPRRDGRRAATGRVTHAAISSKRSGAGESFPWEIHSAPGESSCFCYGSNAAIRSGVRGAQGFQGSPPVHCGRNYHNPESIIKIASLGIKNLHWQE